MTAPHGQDSPWTARAKALARKHHAEGLSAGESAKLLGDPFNRNMVVGFRHRAGLRVPPKPPPPPPKPKPVVVAKPKPLPPPRPIVADGAPPKTARVWTTRTRRECCWPVGGRGADTLYCCAPIEDDNVIGWCPAHAAIGYSAGMATAGWRPRRLNA